jgi:hypothetical protein
MPKNLLSRQLVNVAQWLENGCDPQKAALELRGYADDLRAADEPSAGQSEIERLRTTVENQRIELRKLHREIDEARRAFNWLDRHNAWPPGSKRPGPPTDDDIRAWVRALYSGEESAVMPPEKSSGIR